MEETTPVEKHWFKPLMLLLALFVLTFLLTAFFVENRRESTADDFLSKISSSITGQASVGNVNTSVRSSIPQLETADDPFLGPEQANVIVVQFIDYQCPFCKQAFSPMRELALEYKDRVKFIVRDFPLSDIHPQAQGAAEAAGCAQAQGMEKYWVYHDKLYLNQDALSNDIFTTLAGQAGLDRAQFSACLASGERKAEVAEDYQDGAAAGVRGTPTYFINGRMVQGVIPKESFAKVLDLLLEN